MFGEVSVLVDTIKCIGCRSCQVACKQWHNLPAEYTVNSGSYQNPPSLSGVTYTVVRFHESEHDGELNWNFFKDQCRHCVDPPCKYSVDEIKKGAITIDKSGAVIYTENAKLPKKTNVKEFCPWEIPEKNTKQELWVKCDFCYDRLANDVEPACVKACPSGALVFGERNTILKLADQRLSEIKKKKTGARLLDKDDVRWIYLLADKEKYYGLSRKNRDIFLGKKRNPVRDTPGWWIAASLALFFRWRENRISGNKADV